MPSASQCKKSSRVCLTVAAPSKAGKTRMLASLANLGYKIRLLDSDQGYDPLVQAVKPEFLENVDIVPIGDSFTVDGAGEIIFKDEPHAWIDFCKLLVNWRYYYNPETRKVYVPPAGRKPPEKYSKEPWVLTDLGSPKTWGSDTVLAIDSLTNFARALYNAQVYINGRWGLSKPSNFKDYGTAATALERVFDTMILSGGCGCHFIVLTHAKMIGRGEKDENGNYERYEWYPEAIGQKIPLGLGKWFNTLVTITTNSQGRREVITSPMADMALGSVVSFDRPVPQMEFLPRLFEEMTGNSKAPTPEQAVLLSSDDLEVLGEVSALEPEDATETSSEKEPPRRRRRVNSD